MTSSFPRQVLEQAKYDAQIGGRNVDKNFFQRIQDLIKNNTKPLLNPSKLTPAQQTDFDARKAKEVSEKLNKNKVKAAVPQVSKSRMARGRMGGIPFLIELAARGAGASTGVAAEDPANKFLGVLTAAFPQTGGTLATMKMANNWANKQFKTEDDIFQGRGAGLKSFEVEEPQSSTPVPGTPEFKRLYPDAVPGGYGISNNERMRLEMERERKNKRYDREPPAPPETSLEPPVEDGIDLNRGQRGVARLDPNAKDLEGVMYSSNFIKGQENMPAMEEYFGSLNTPGLDEWAKANPALAYKEYKKSGQPDIATTEDIKGLMDDSGYTEDQAKKYFGEGIETVIDGDSITEIDNDPMSMANQFKNNYMTEITELLSNEDFNPYPELGGVAKKIGFDLNLDPELMEKMRKRYTEGFGLF